MEGNENRNFLIFLAIVFVTTVVALIVVLSITWRWVAEPIGGFFKSIGRFQSLQALDYNFEIPEAQEEEDNEEEEDNQDEEENEDQEEEVEEEPAPEYDFVFEVPVKSFDRSNYRRKGSILQDAISQGYFTQTNDLTEVKYTIQIPKIGLSAQAYSGLGEQDLLEKGFWILPESGDEDLGEIVMICYSNFFFPTDKRSCEDLDLLEIGDKIFVRSLEDTFEYEIYDIDESTLTDESLYTIVDPELESNLLPAIRIVSSIPDESDNSRIIIFGEQNPDSAI